MGEEEERLVQICDPFFFVVFFVVVNVDCDMTEYMLVGNGTERTRNPGFKDAGFEVPSGGYK